MWLKIPTDDDDCDKDDILNLILCLFVYVVPKEEIDWTLVIMAISLAASVAIIVILVCVICTTCIKSQTRSGKSFKSTNLLNIKPKNIVYEHFFSLLVRLFFSPVLQ